MLASLPLPVVDLRDTHEVEVVRAGPGDAERVLEGHGGQVGLQLALDDGRRVLHPRRAHGDGALVDWTPPIARRPSDCQIIS